MGKLAGMDLRTQWAELACSILDAREAPVPDQVRALFASGRIFGFEGHCVGPVDLEGWEPGQVYEARPCPPHWEAADMFDDAVVGDDGDWPHGTSHLPVFILGSGVLVVRLDDPELAVGYFEEGSWSRDGGGFRDGVFSLWPSLEACLGALRPIGDGEVVAVEAEDEALWAMAAELAEG